ncbi:MAG: YhfH-like protein [Paenibacillus sp.]|nr:YhfH-like protein [Paenibacillus sp.]
MLIPAKDFFDNLPSKQCNKCGTAMEEQTECYETVCSNCQDTNLYKTFTVDQSAP